MSRIKIEFFDRMQKEREKNWWPIKIEKREERKKNLEIEKKVLFPFPDLWKSSLEAKLGR